MRVVVDTNVLVSGVLNPHGAPGQVVDLIISEGIRLLYDDRILSEYREVLLRPAFGFDKDDIEVLLRFAEVAGEKITVEPVNVVLSDPTDLPFLEVAVSGGADALITGNGRHFKSPGSGHRVSIQAPAEFLRIYRE